MGLGAESDALALASIAVRRRCDGYTIVEVPSRRDFWYGNALVLDREPADDDRPAWIARHARLFPHAGIGRRTIVWETAAVREPRASRSERDVETSIVFARRSPFGAPPDDRVRPLRAREDWDAAAAIDAAEHAESSPAMQAFARWRFALTRADAAAGRVRMWGAWDRGELAAFAGIYASDALARFATPVTRSRSRGRGFFRALCATAVDATLHAAPAAPVVIVAAAGGDPETIYRRLGFSAVGAQVGLLAALAPCGP